VSNAALKRHQELFLLISRFAIDGSRYWEACRLHECHWLGQEDEADVR
jgi:hypothetical protein